MTTSALDLQPLRRAISSMDEGLALLAGGAWLQAQPEAVVNTLRAGVIQSFEYTYELSVKMLKRRLRLDAESRAVIDTAGFRDLIRMGGQRGLVSSVEAWFAFRDLRNETAHTYNVVKAEQVAAEMPTFIAEAKFLLGRLEASSE
jgi:nucleotidyltransferase substrate binding protein (TIGR01987 family)